MKIVSQLDANGYFVGPCDADPSPLEEGVWLIPGGAIDVPPPDIPAGKVALWQGGAWAFVSPPDETQQADPPVAGVPQVVSRAQGEIALHRAGLLAAVEAYMADPETDPEVRIWWLRSQVFRRTSSVVQAVGDALGMTPQKLDELFTAAAGIDA